MCEYPNLQLLAYIFRNSLALVGTEDIREETIDAHVFPQVWPNTGGGFAKPGYMYGQSMTKEYTTVLFYQDFAMVCFGNRPAYLINHPNKTFMQDFALKNMKSAYHSEKAYKEEDKHVEEKSV